MIRIGHSLINCIMFLCKLQIFIIKLIVYIIYKTLTCKLKKRHFKLINYYRAVTLFTLLIFYFININHEFYSTRYDIFILSVEHVLLSVQPLKVSSSAAPLYWDNQVDVTGHVVGIDCKLGWSWTKEIYGNHWSS